MIKNQVVYTIVIGFIFASITACSGQATATPAVVTESTTLVVAEGHIVPNMDLKLTFPYRGKISEIIVSEGQKVSKGEVLVRQGDNEQAKATLTTAKLELVQAQQASDEFARTASLLSAQAFSDYQAAQIARSQAQIIWEAVDSNTVRDDIDTAQTDVQDKKKVLDDANDTLKKYLDLKTDNPTRRTAEDDVRKAQSDYNAAQRKVEELQRSIDGPRSKLDAAIAAESESRRAYENTLGNTLDPDKKAILDARLENALAQVSAAENAFNNYDLKAPFGGVVTDVNVTLGELVGSDKFAIQMADFSNWYVETSDLTELEVAKISIGQDVEIAPDSIPDLILKGKVESIGESFKSQGGDILYTVKILMSEFDPNLRWGMTVQTTFLPVVK